MTGASPLAYDAWLNLCVIDRLVGTPANHNPPASAPLQTIPATYIVQAVREQAAGTIQVIGGLRCRNFKIEGDLHLENYIVPFPLFFHGCTFTGDLYIWSLKAKTLAFFGCTLEGGADIRSTHIDGHLNLRDGCVVLGPVIARDMDISGMADFTGATFAYDGWGDCPLAKDAAGDCFGFSRSRARTLYWRNLAKPPAGRVTFRDAHVQSFVHDLGETPALRSWPAQGLLTLDGFSYDRIDQCDPDRAMAWLALQKDFTASSYSALARGFERLHLSHSAGIVWAKLKKQEIKQLRPAMRRYLNALVYGLVGYGQRPFNALWAVLFLFLAHFAVVSWAQQANLMRPLINEMLLESCFYGPGKECVKDLKKWRSVPVEGDEKRYLPVDYPKLVPVEYSLESFVPLLQFDQGKYWEASDMGLRIFLPTLAALGIFVGGVFVGGISGLISPKSRDS